MEPKSTAAIDRPVRLRMRPDLIAIERCVAGETRFVIKDPISLAHHQLWDEEFALLKMLDGKTSMASIKQVFEEKFKPARIDFSLLELLYGQFHRNGLVLSEHSGQGEQLFQIHERERRGKLNSGLLNLLAWRFRGVNPDALLAICDSWLGWVFSRRCLVVSALFILTSFLYMATQWPSVVQRLPELMAYLTPSNLLWMAVAFMLLKVMHEFAHGLACKHFGGECNEMGLMFLIFTPCLYCDVSDSWMIDSKWKRAFVAAAGVWIEMLVAAICLWIWWFSYPGSVNSIAFNAVVIGSIGTIAFNANPLLRYDGYFVLSDIVEAPNLWYQSSVVFEESWKDFFVRNIRPAHRIERHRLFLWIFACASIIYRCVLTATIAIFLYKLCQYLRLELVGVSLVGLILATFLRRPMKALIQLAKDTSRLRHLRLRRICATITVMAAMMGIAFCIPFPVRIAAPGFIQYADTMQIVNVVEGTLVHALREGSTVRRGDEIARLESRPLMLELMARRGELARQKVRLSGLESRRSSDAAVSSLIPTVQESIDGITLEVERLESEFEQLTLRSPMDGTVIPAKSRRTGSEQSTIESWEGTPLRPENVGCRIELGTQLCQVSSMSKLEATAYLEPSQVELVRKGHNAIVKLKQYPNHAFKGSVLEVGLMNESSLTVEAWRSMASPSQAERAQSADTEKPVYAARILIEGDLVLPIPQAQGVARIEIDPQPLATRLIRLFHETFMIDPTAQAETSR